MNEKGFIDYSPIVLDYGVKIEKGQRCTHSECSPFVSHEIVVTVWWATKGTISNGDVIYSHTRCPKHLLSLAASNTPEGMLIRDERLRILTITGINICGE